MSKEIKYSRLILKRSDVPTLSATTAPSTDHTVLPAWRTTDIYVGELFLNTEDEKMWVRTDNSIKEIPLLDGSSSLNAFPDVLISNPTDGQVLTFSGGTWYNKNPQFEGTGITYTTVSPLMMTTPMMSVTSPVTSPTIIETSLKIEKIVDIEDVSVTNLSNFDVLIRKDNKWINMSSADLPVKKTSLYRLQDVDIKEPQLDQYLVFAGDRWINKTKLDSIQGLAWDKAESKLMIYTDQGVFNLLIQGKPIHTIIEDVELDNTYHTVIVDASTQDINILLPPAQKSYGDIFKIKVINYTYNTIIYPAESEFIYIDSLLEQLIISEDSSEKDITLQCDGNSTWYSI